MKQITICANTHDLIKNSAKKHKITMISYLNIIIKKGIEKNENRNAETNGDNKKFKNCG